VNCQNYCRAGQLGLELLWDLKSAQTSNEPALGFTLVRSAGLG
jgi:hypothetical protein